MDTRGRLDLGVLLHVLPADFAAHVEPRGTHVAIELPNRPALGMHRRLEVTHVAIRPVLPSLAQERQHRLRKASRVAAAHPLPILGAEWHAGRREGVVGCKVYAGDDIEQGRIVPNAVRLTAPPLSDQRPVRRIGRRGHDDRRTGAARDVNVGRGIHNNLGLDRHTPRLAFHKQTGDSAVFHDRIAGPHGQQQLNPPLFTELGAQIRHQARLVRVVVGRAALLNHVNEHFGDAGQSTDQRAIGFVVQAAGDDHRRTDVATERGQAINQQRLGTLLARRQRREQSADAGSHHYHVHVVGYGHSFLWLDNVFHRPILRHLPLPAFVCSAAAPRTRGTTVPASAVASRASRATGRAGTMPSPACTRSPGTLP